mmetsp:Transcript_8460/g.22603  ORF Transcript_8460/g.22603 Transcript_8460/m.22603 type:complete len:226 (-) Transcript_8460:1139-1816(-)
MHPPCPATHLPILLQYGIAKLPLLSSPPQHVHPPISNWRRKGEGRRKTERRKQQQHTLSMHTVTASAYHSAQRRQGRHEISCSHAPALLEHSRNIEGEQVVQPLPNHSQAERKRRRRQALRYADSGKACQTGRNSHHIVRVRVRHRVHVSRAADSVSCGRCGRDEQHVNTAEGCVEVIDDHPPYFLRLFEVRFERRCTQHIRAQHDPPFHFGSKPFRPRICVHSV